MRLAWTSFALFSSHSSAAEQSHISFATLGDWGGVGAGGWYANYQRGVAAGLTQAAAEHNISFVVNVGDSFYWAGVKSVQDPLWKSDFEDVYANQSLMVPWYSALGNHDYGKNPGAQVEYQSPNSNRWVMPARYYKQRIALGQSGFLSLVVLDTNPCIADYRSDNSVNWDPDVEEAPLFHKNIMNQTCLPQLAWFKESLASVPADDWLIVMGHHPLEQVDVADFVTPLLAAKPDMYLAGHIHLLQQYTLNEQSTPFVISGAGCMIHTKDQTSRTLSRKHKLDQGRLWVTPDVVWTSTTAGFTIHSFSLDLQTLTTDYMDNNGKVLHSFNAKKQSRLA